MIVGAWSGCICLNWWFAADGSNRDLLSIGVKAFVNMVISWSNKLLLWSAAVELIVESFWRTFFSNERVRFRRFIMTRSRELVLRKLMFALNCNLFWIMAENAVLIMSTRPVFSVEFNLLSTIMAKLIFSVVLKYLWICVFNLILTWSWGFRNLLFTLYTYSHIFRIVAKITMFFVSSRSIVLI